MRIRFALAAALLAASVFGSTKAFAWGCFAVSENGTYGYSYYYDNQDDASQRALNECAKRATTDQTCVIDSCDEDN